MHLQQTTSGLPDFIVRSTFGVAIVSVFLLTPFGINNLLQGRYVLGELTLSITLLCMINVWLCYKGVYNLQINLLGIAPAITITIILATHELGIKGSYWAFLAVLGLYFILPKKWALIANILFIVILVPVAFDVIENHIAIRFSSVLLGTSIFAFLSMHEITKQHNLVKQRAITDTLTGLYNRSILEYTLDHAIKVNRRTRAATTLIMLDIDNFKTVNDEFGHQAGDSVLKSLSSLLKSYFRESDTVFRIGGEEFLVVAYNTDKIKAQDLAEKLRKKIEKHPLIPDYRVTISAGITEIEPDIEWGEWMKRCDEKLYCAKANGRNQIVV